MARNGDKVRITCGKYEGTVGTYDADKGVYIEGVGYTGNVHPGRNIEPVSSNTPDRNVENGREVPIRQRSQAYREWEALYSQPDGPTDAQLTAYERKWKSSGYGLVAPHRGFSLGRLLFGKNNTRVLWRKN